MSNLVQRLRGEYRIPITDGLGPAGGEEPDNSQEFVRTFQTPPIQKDAADRIEWLEEALRKLKGAAADAAVYADAPKTHEMDDGEAGVVCAWEVLHNLRLAIADADAALS